LDVSIPADLRYSVEHEWLRLDGDTGTIGITQYAAEQVSDIVFVDLPAVGATLTQGKPFGAIESVKAVSELFAPVSGTITEVNPALADAPDAISTDAFGAGWLVKIRLSNPADAAALMDAAAYGALIGQ
jgi:glycine cleavage system H protein